MKFDTPEYRAGNIVDSILARAITIKASDIHIDMEREMLNVRLRVDGVLYPFEGLEQENPEELVSKIKIMSGVDIIEKRLPQDGHLEFEYEDKKYNFRVATTPTIYGESLVMRILNKEAIAENLADLGFSLTQLEMVEKIINSPFGMALITGPQGSGKTTLLYSFLNKLNKPERNLSRPAGPISPGSVTSPPGWFRDRSCFLR